MSQLLYLEAGDNITSKHGLTERKDTTNPVELSTYFTSIRMALAIPLPRLYFRFYDSTSSFIGQELLKSISAFI